MRFQSAFERVNASSGAEVDWKRVSEFAARLQKNRRDDEAVFERAGRPADREPTISAVNVVCTDVEATTDTPTDAAGRP